MTEKEFLQKLGQGAGTHYQLPAGPSWPLDPASGLIDVQPSITETPLHFIRLFARDPLDQFGAFSFQLCLPCEIHACDSEAYFTGELAQGLSLLIHTIFGICLAKLIVNFKIKEYGNSNLDLIRRE